MSPRVFATSERVGNCFETVFKRSALDFSFKLEAFMLSGVQGKYGPTFIDKAHGYDRGLRKLPMRDPYSEAQDLRHHFNPAS